MADIVINPAIGKIDFFTTKGENVTNTLRLTGNTLLVTGPLSASSISTGGGGAFVTSTQPTSNYLSKFTGNSTIANSLIYDNGTNVGIGTTSPGAKLAVIGTSLTDPNNDAISREIFYALNRTVASAAGSTTLLGYLTPTGKSDHATIEIYHHDCGTIEYIKYELVSPYYVGTTTDWVQLPTINNISYTGALTGVTVDARLSANFANIELRLRSLGDSCGNMIVYVSIKTNCTFTQQSTTGTGGTIAGLLCNNAYQFPVGANRFEGTTNRGLYVVNTGNVGIGTQSPVGRFDVRPDSSWVSAGAFVVDTDGSNNPRIRLYRPDGASATTSYPIHIRNDSGNLNILTGNAATLGSETVTSKFYFTSAGNLGIGTTSPSFKVDVVGAVRSTIDNDFGFALKRSATNVWTGLGYYTANNSKWFVGLRETGDDNLRWYNYTNSAERMVLTEAGSLGVGTTSPATKLDIYGPVSVRGTTVLTTNFDLNAGNAADIYGNIRVLRGASLNDGMYIGYGGAGGNLKFFSNSGTTEFMTIATTGNVGIGSTSPAAKLEVLNTANSATYVRINNQNSGAAAYTGVDLQSYGGGWQVRVPASATFANSLQFSFNDAERVRITYDGNVGIGTTTPTARLDVSGGGLSVSGWSNNNSGTTGGVEIGWDGNWGIFQVYDRVNANYEPILINGSYTMFYVSGAERARLNSSGNLGIGTTSPAYKLDVIGDARVSGGIFNASLSAQWIVNGGGTVTYNGSAILWSNRVIVIPVEKDELSTTGYIDINCPTSGTITYYNASNVTTTVTCAASGVPIAAWEALYYEITPGQGQASDQTKFRLVNYQNSTWKPSSNWILICALNGDSNSLKWIPGQVIIPNNGSFDSSNSTNNWQIAGTTNYVSKFTAANKIGNSVLYDNGTNIGIGTTSPAAKFQVGTHSIGDAGNGDNSANVRIGAASAGARVYGMTLANTATATLSNESALSFVLAGNYSATSVISAVLRSTVNAATDLVFTNYNGSLQERMRILYDGNVGIGTTSPSTKLHIYENANRVTYISQNDNHTARFEAYGTATAIDTTASNGIFFRINSGDIVKFAADGNVGIGTSTATAPLHIYRASNPWIRLNGGGSFGYIRLDDGTSNGYLFKNTSSDTSNGALAGAMYTYTDSGKAFQHIHSGTPLFTILSGGNVGIGTTSPLAKLSIGNGSLADGNIPVQISSAGTNTESYFGINKNGSYGLIVGYYQGSSFSGVGAYIRQVTSDPIHFLVNNNVTAMSMISSGNIGIGTTSPAYKLDVGAVGSNSVSVRLTPGFERVRYNGFDLIGYNDGNLWMIGNNATNTLILGGSWDWDRQIAIAYTPATTGLAGGSLEIGQMTKNNANFTHGNTRFYTNGVERLRIQSDGNVGIGTTSPGALLNIRASTPTSTGTLPTGTNVVIDSNTSNYLTFRNTGDNGTYAGLIFLDNNVGGYISFRNYTADGVAAGSDCMIYGSFQDHIFQNGYVNETLYNRTETMRIKSSGYVGINTNNPTARLHVVQGNSGGVAAILLSSDESTIQGPSANTQIRMGSNLVLNASGIIPIGTNGSEKMRIQSDGNVGIGTTSAGQKLDVFGSMAATIYYDRDNGAYYVDPAGTSNLVGLTVSNTITGNITGNSGGSSTFVASLGSGLNYDIDRTTKRAGLSHYSGYSTGTNRPTTYDYTLQVTDGSKGWEISMDWIATTGPAIYARSLRDCCQNWSSWVRILDSANYSYAANMNQNVRTTDNVTHNIVDATQFRDSANTSYYLDPASTSVLNYLSLSILNNMNPANGTWHTSAEGKARFYFASNSTTYFRTGADFIFRNNSDSGILVIDASGNLRTTSGGDNSPSYSLHVGGTGYAVNDFRAPIFYDSANTSYYVDPASTSNINILSLVSYGYINGQTLNGQSFYQWEGATYRNPGDHTPQLLIRKDNSSTGINGFAPALALYNNNGGDQTTVGMTFVSAEAVSPTQGNAVELSGIIAKKESTGTAGGWSRGSLNFYVKDFGTRRDVMYMSPDGTVTVTGTDNNSGKADLSVDTGGTATMALSGQYFRVGSTDVNWAMKMQSNGYLATYGQQFDIATVSGDNAITFATNGTNRVNIGGSTTETVKITGYSNYVGNYGYNTLTLIDTSGYPGLNYRSGNNNWLMRMDGGGTYSMNWSSNASAKDVGTFSTPFYFGTGGTGYASSDFRAPIFYDANDTSYYVDPNSTSNILELKTNKNWYDSSATAWGGGINMGGNNPTIGFQSTASTWWYMFHHSSNVINFYRRSTSGGWNQDCVWDSSGNFIWRNGSIRAPIFYDFDNTSYYLDPASTTTSLQIAGAIEQGNDLSRPLVQWGASGDTTGMIVIKLPGTSSNYGMIHAIIDIYEYNSFNVSTIIVGGHNWNGYWYNYGANVVGYTNKTVRLGFKDGQYCIVLGGASSTWSYGQVVLRKIQNGSYYTNAMDLGGVYNISQTATESFTWVTGDLTQLRTPGTFIAYGDVRAPIFYDSANTSYYVDPASTSVLYSIAAGVAGNSSANIPALKVTSAGTATTQAAIAIQQQTSEGDTIIFCDYDQYVEWNLVHENANNQLIIHGGSSTGNLGSNTFYSPNGTAKTGYIKQVFDQTDGNVYIGGSVGIGTNGPGQKLDVRGTIISNADVRAPIFYDSANTTYYIDPGSTTSLRTVGSWRSDSAAWDGEFNGKIQYHANHWYFQSGDLWLFRNSGGSNVVSISQGGIVNLSGITGAGNTYIQTSTTGTSYTSHFQIREANGGGGNTSEIYAPALGFHWSGVVASNILMEASGRIAIRNNPGSGYENFIAAIVYAGSSVQAPIFYDSNNTTYYLDPAASTSLNIAGQITTAITNGTLLSIAGADTFGYNSTAGRGTYIKGTSTTYVYGSGVYYDGSNIRQMLYEDTWLNNKYFDSNGIIYSQASMRAPIFYDYNDTSYYLDPNGGSVLKDINLNLLQPRSGVTHSDIYAQDAIINSYYHGDALTYDVFQFNAASLYEVKLTSTHSFSSTTVETSIFKGDRFGGMTIANNTYQVRWTWSNTIGYKFFKTLYLANSTNGNSFSVTIEYSGNGSTWSTLATSGQMSNWPGHSWYNYAWNNNAAQGYIRLTITPTWNNGNSIDIYNMRYFCSYNLDASTRLYDWDYSRNVTFAVSLRAPIFYDSDNTSYYVDPASTSNLVGLTVANTITGNISGNAATATTAGTCTGTANSATFYANNGSYGAWAINGTRNGWGGIEFANNGVSLMMGSDTVGFHQNTNGWLFRVHQGVGFIYKGAWGGGTAATILDSVNASYAWNMNQNVRTSDTCSFAGLTVSNTINGSITGNAATATSAGCVNSDTGNVGGNRLQYWQVSGDTNLNPDTQWYNAIRMGHGDPVTYYSNTLAVRMTGGNLGDIYTRTTTNGTPGTWNRFWNNNNDGAGSGLDADLLDGLDVHTGRNNEANKVVRTDSNGYIQAGWINTTSGDMPDTESIDRIYCSNDAYVRYKGVADFKQQIGLTYKNATPRSVSTADTNYWTGMMGWSTTDFNTMVTWGCGFIDSWGSPGNSPGAGYTHFVGLQSFHYTNGDTDGTDNYGYQLVAGNGNTSPLYLRVNWGSAGSWRTMLDSSNYNSYSPSLTGNGASGNWAINVTGTAASISGFNNPATAATVSTIAYRDANADLTARYFLANRSSSGASTCGIQLQTAGTSRWWIYLRQSDDNVLAFYTSNATADDVVRMSSTGLGIKVDPSNRLHINGDNTNPAIRVDNGAINTSATSNSKTFYGWLPISIAGTTKWIQLYN